MVAAQELSIPAMQGIWSRIAGNIQVYLHPFWDELLFETINLQRVVFLPLAMTASSGLAATSMVMQTLKSGDHVLSVNDVYGGE